MRHVSEIIFGVDDSEYGVGSAYDQRGHLYHVETLDGFGASKKKAVADLNKQLVERGMAPFPTDGFSDKPLETWEETHRWTVVATLIL